LIATQVPKAGRLLALEESDSHGFYERTDDMEVSLERNRAYGSFRISAAMLAIGRIFLLVTGRIFCRIAWGEGSYTFTDW
jgi:hypothetical protein